MIARKVHDRLRDAEHSTAIITVLHDLGLEIRRNHSVSSGILCRVKMIIRFFENVLCRSFSIFAIPPKVTNARCELAANTNMIKHMLAYIATNTVRQLVYSLLGLLSEHEDKFLSTIARQ
jgi:hypothetical protein